MIVVTITMIEHLGIYMKALPMSEFTQGSALLHI